MNEREFLTALQKRTKEQEKLMKDMLFPKVYITISVWLGNHPWRLLIPLAFIFTLIFHYLIGKSYDDLILRIFGGPK